MTRQLTQNEFAFADSVFGAGWERETPLTMAAAIKLAYAAGGLVVPVEPKVDTPPHPRKRPNSGYRRGDLLRCINNDGYSSSLQVGNLYEVDRLSNDGQIWVRGPGLVTDGLYGEHRFEFLCRPLQVDDMVKAPPVDREHCVIGGPKQVVEGFFEVGVWSDVEGYLGMDVTDIVRADGLPHLLPSQAPGGEPTSAAVSA